MTPLKSLLCLLLAVGGLQLTQPAVAASPKVASVVPLPAPAANSQLQDQRKHVDPASRSPLQAPSNENALPGMRSAGLAAAACTTADIISKTGAALVNAVKAADIKLCLNPLFDLKGADAQRAFSESQMLTIASALRSNVAAYPGDNSVSTNQLIVYLRAGYYVYFGVPGTIPAYSATLLAEVRGFFDTFFNSSTAYTNTDENGEVVKAAVWLITNVQDEVRNIGVAGKLLNAYNTNFGVNMREAVNRAFELYWRSHYRTGIAAAAQSNPAVITVLSDFAVRNLGLLPGDNFFLTANAGRELANFLRYSPLLTTVRPLVRDLLNRTQITGPTAALWVFTAANANYFDGGNCTYFGVCDLVNRLKAAALPITHNCSSSLTIRAQALTSAQLASTCSSLLSQDAYFHGLVNDAGPVPDDHTVGLEVSVFDTRRDYQLYAAEIYNISVDNGGISLEYDPSQIGNLARFIAYEQDREMPLGWQIWNLNHEYTHYLDSKYDMHGDFTEGQATPTVWWVEGFAEYISYSYRQFAFTAAIQQAGLHTFKLSALFDTVYGDNNRTYSWGYLAVRYMLERHPADVATVLGHYRAGNWAAARTVLKGLNYDADFDSWLTACANGACKGSNNMLPTADFTTTASNQTISFTNIAADPDGTISQYHWEFGDGTTSTVANPVKVYGSGGAYTVKLVVRDNNGATWGVFKTITVPASSGGGGYPECAGSDTRALGKNCKRSNMSAGAGGLAYFYIYLPAGVSTLTVASSGGTGDVDLYYNSASWATSSAYTQRAIGSGNTHTITVTNPASGYRYVSLYGVTAASGVTVTAAY